MPKETAVYTHGHHESVLRSHRWRTAANSAAYLLGELAPGHVGPGRRLRARHDHRGPGRAGRARPGHGVDAAADVLDAGRATPRPNAAWTTSTFAVADVHALDFPDDSFDVVHAHQVLQHVGDPVQALREMRRVCRPGGVVAARDSDYAAMTWYPEAPGTGRLAGAVPPGGPRQRRRAGRRPPAAVLGAAGRASPTSPPTAATWCFATPEERAWWSGLWADRTTASAYARAGGRRRPRRPRRSWRRSRTAWRAWGARATPGSWCRTARCCAGSVTGSAPRGRQQVPIRSRRANYPRPYGDSRNHAAHLRRRPGGLGGLLRTPHGHPAAALRARRGLGRGGRLLPADERPESELEILRKVTATIAVKDVDERTRRAHERRRPVIAGPVPTPVGRNLIAVHPDGSVFEYVDRKAAA